MNRMKHAIGRLLLAWACLLLAPALPLRAEGDASVQSWRIIQAAPRVAPAQPGQTYRARRRYDTPRNLYPDDATLGLVLPEVTVALPDPAEGMRPRILVIGDSMADALAAGMNADPAIKADLALFPKTVSSSGLVREDYHDWPKTLREMFSATPDAAAAIVMIGLNDRQAIRSGETSLDPLGEPWLDAYRQRVDAIIRLAQEARVPLVWVGLPIMRSPRLSQDMATLNALIRDRVTQAGETFVETYESFADGSGGFTATGPDIIGDIVRLRGPDGIHFTPAGQRKLAFFVEKPLRLRIQDRLNAASAALASPVSVPAQQAPAGETIASLPAGSLLPPTERAITLPAPAAAPPAVIRQRPEIGEIRPLSVQNAAPALAASQAPAIADPVTRDLFDRGLAPDPRPGRADDFRWR
ncbi:MAG: DUF459 domain-containing protein [Beijerinckiaceae bacterium]|nr:DUF459 domain-containing protein [Beijerinckiaceae bacterium]